MQQIKLFSGAATTEGIVELEQVINKWITKGRDEGKGTAKKEIKIVNVSISVRQIPTGERLSLTAEITDQLVVCLTYET